MGARFELGLAKEHIDILRKSIEQLMEGEDMIEMRGTLPDFGDDGLDREVRSIISAIAELGGKVIVTIKPKSRFHFGGVDILLCIVLLIVVILGGC